MDRRVGKKRVPAKPKWYSLYQPGDEVKVAHYKGEVTAILVRQKIQPAAWIVKKLLGGQWTKEVVVADRQIRRKVS